MTKSPQPPDAFSEKWQRAGAEAQRKVAGKPLPDTGKPIARILYEKALHTDPAFQNDKGNFNVQVALTAWLRGWMDAEMGTNPCKPKAAPSAGHFGQKKGVRSEQEIAALRDKLAKLIEFSPVAQDMLLFDAVHDDPRFIFACHVGDVLDWVLGKTSTEEFMSDSYIDMEHLQHILRR
jgi:hypothetical protein